MRNIIYLNVYVFMTLFLIGNTNAQNAFVPDTNFRNFLNTSYSGVMDGSGDSIVITNAAAISGTFLCNNENIVDLTGIEHFTNITILACLDNQISIMPALTALTKLDVLTCGSNNLTALPLLPDSLTALRCDDNQLTTLPDLSTLVDLTELRCRNNYLTSLPDLSLNTALEILMVNDNLLTSLPDLSGNPMTWFRIWNNKLDFSDAKEIQGVDSMTTLFDGMYFPQGGFPLSMSSITLNEGDALTVTTPAQDSATSFKWYVGNLSNEVPGVSDSILSIPNITLPVGYNYGDTISYYCRSFGTALKMPPLVWDTASVFYSELLKVVILDTAAPVAISEMTNIENSITIFPNPSNGVFSVKVNSNGQASLSYSIYNSGGQIVLRDKFVTEFGRGAHSIQLDLAGLAKGLYQFKLDDESAAQSFLIE